MIVCCYCRGYWFIIIVLQMLTLQMYPIDPEWS